MIQRIKTKFWKLMNNAYSLPMWFKLILAKIFVRCLKDMTNDIVLYNELQLWIETEGRPQTSNPNHWVNTYSK